MNSFWTWWMSAFMNMFSQFDTMCAMTRTGFTFDTFFSRIFLFLLICRWTFKNFVTLFSRFFFLIYRWSTRLFNFFEFRQGGPDFVGRRYLRRGRFDLWMVYRNLWTKRGKRRFPSGGCVCFALPKSTSRRHPGKLKINRFKLLTFIVAHSENLILKNMYNSVLYSHISIDVV